MRSGIFFFKKGRRRRGWGDRDLKRDLDSYIVKLSTSPEPVKVTEAVRAHSAKLLLEIKHEWRLRSLQTLLDVRYPKGVVPALNELMLMCTSWPEDDAIEESLFLIELLRQFWSCADSGVGAKQDITTETSCQDPVLQ